MTFAHTNPQGDGGDLLHRLWLYTNYDCNLSCSYCVAESFVGAERNGLTLPQVCRLIDEAVEIGMTEIFFTGGEPFILHDIFTMLRHGLERMQVTVLSNGILLKGQRLRQLEMLPYRERIIHVPTSSRLQMSDAQDRLALAFNSFFVVLEVMPGSDKKQEFRFAITPTLRTSPLGSAMATAIVSAWTSSPRYRTLRMTGSFRMWLCVASLRLAT